MVDQETAKNGKFTKDDFFNCLPEVFNKNNTLVYESNSPEKDDVNFDHPRRISFSEKLVIAATGNPAGKHNEVVQILDYSTKPMTYYQLDFSNALSLSHSMKNKNPQECLGCHAGVGGKIFKPIWADYPIWPGVYGSEDDVMTTGDRSHHQKLIRNFVANESQFDEHGRLYRNDKMYSIDNPTQEHTIKVNQHIEKESALYMKFISEKHKQFVYKNMKNIPSLEYNNRKTTFTSDGLIEGPVSTRSNLLLTELLVQNTLDEYMNYLLTNHEAEMSNLLKQICEGKNNQGEITFKEISDLINANILGKILNDKEFNFRFTYDPLKEEQYEMPFNKKVVLDGDLDDPATFVKDSVGYFKLHFINAIAIKYQKLGTYLRQRSALAPPYSAIEDDDLHDQLRKRLSFNKIPVAEFCAGVNAACAQTLVSAAQVEKNIKDIRYVISAGLISKDDFVKSKYPRFLDQKCFRCHEVKETPSDILKVEVKRSTEKTKLWPMGSFLTYPFSCLSMNKNVMPPLPLVDDPHFVNKVNQLSEQDFADLKSYIKEHFNLELDSGPIGYYKNVGKYLSLEHDDNSNLIAKIYEYYSCYNSREKSMTGMSLDREKFLADLLAELPNEANLNEKNKAHMRKSLEQIMSQINERIFEKYIDRTNKPKRKKINEIDQATQKNAKNIANLIGDVWEAEKVKREKEKAQSVKEKSN